MISVQEQLKTIRRGTSEIINEKDLYANIEQEFLGRS